MKKIIAPLSSYAQLLLNLAGKPFDLSNRKHLGPIYNHEKKKTLLLFSRQAEKSTTLASKMVTRSCVFPHFKSLYVAPRMTQVKQFSDQKLRDFIDNSPRVIAHYQNKHSKTSTFYKTFSNKSDITLRSAYLNPDATRGISADCLYLDELQDLIEDHLPVIQSCLQHAQPWAGFTEMCGTPKTMQNFIQKQWEKSSKMEWIIKCGGCNNYNLLDTPNIGKFHMICNKCGRQIHKEHGQWMTTNPSGTFPAYRICYLMVPWVKWFNPEDPEDPGVIQMYEDWSEAKFRNETMAQSFDNATNPITVEDFVAVCEDRPICNGPADVAKLNKKFNVIPIFYGGVDWGTSQEGKSKTVFSVGAYCADGKFRILFVYKFPSSEADPDFQVRKIIIFCKLWNIGVLGVDWGFGQMQNATLHTALPGIVVTMYTSGSLKKAIVFRPDLQDYTISRSQTLTKVFLDIKNKNLLFYNYDTDGDTRNNAKNFSQDILCVGIEYSFKNRMSHYVHPTGSPDDALHSINYCLCSYMIHKGHYHIKGDGEIVDY